MIKKQLKKGKPNERRNNTKFLTIPFYVPHDKTLHLLYKIEIGKKGIFSLTK